MVKGRLRTERILIVWAVLTALWGGYFYRIFPIKNVSTFSYTILILFWVYSLKNEITDAYIRRNMSLGGVLLTLLFILRFIKYNLVPKYTFPHRLMWYGYYIPILITPLLSLMISLAIGNKNAGKYRKFLFFLKIICALLLIIVLTNDCHGLAIKIRYEGNEEYSSMGPFYYLIIIWYLTLMLSSFVIALRKCILSSYKRGWIIPAAIELFGIILWCWYNLICKGSSPKIGDYSLYNIQEVYVLLFIGFWEAMISVGLIPTVSLAKDRAWINDGVFGTVRQEILEIRDIFDRIQDADDAEFFNGMSRISFIGIYIKRRANLELISSKSGLLSSGELSLAIREALEYFDFSKISAGFEESGESVEVPEPLIAGILDLLKNMLCKTVSACYVKLVTGKTQRSVSVMLTVEADMDLSGSPGDADNPALIADKDFFKELGAELDIYEEDDTWKVHIKAAYPVHNGKTIGYPALKNSSGYGLSQITSYLSLEKEALETKTRIHDSLGRCLLVTKAYLTGQYPMTRAAIISEWDQVLSEMSGDFSEKPAVTSTKADYFIAQAKNMGIDVEVTGKLPDDDRIKRILDTALTAHITNVLRHASGNKAFVDIRSKAGSYVISFTNNGEAPKGRIIEKGGLKNLRQHVEGIGGTMEIEWKKGFNMILTLPDTEQI